MAGLANTLAWLRCVSPDLVWLFDSCETGQDWLHCMNNLSVNSGPDTQTNLSYHSMITIRQCSGGLRALVSQLLR